MRFVAIDVETANPSYHSICQIGVVLFEGGQEVAAERIFVNPKEEFGKWQVRIHGIRAEHVADAMCFSDHYEWLKRWTYQETVVSHSHFDRAALARACDRYGLPHLGCDWIDSVGLAMDAWPDLDRFGLKDVAARLGIQFRHHDALEDARACGLIVHHALRGSALQKPVAPKAKAGPWPDHVRRTGDGDGALVGESIVFTGELSINRSVAADMAAEAGGDVQPNVTRRTTMLVVGQRDLLPGWDAKSGKHKKAEALIEQGCDIRIVGETDFMALAAITS